CASRSEPPEGLNGRVPQPATREMSSVSFDRIPGKAKFRETAVLLFTAGACWVAPTGARAEGVGLCAISNAASQQSWEQDCAAAIQAERNPAKRAELHFRRAYVLNERQAYQQALDDLNAACSLVPHHAPYLHERAYTFNSLGRYHEALTDLNEQAGLEP